MVAPVSSRRKKAEGNRSLRESRTERSVWQWQPPPATTEAARRDPASRTRTARKPRASPASARSSSDRYRPATGRSELSSRTLDRTPTPAGSTHRIARRDVSHPYHSAVQEPCPRTSPARVVYFSCRYHPPTAATISTGDRLRGRTFLNVISAGPGATITTGRAGLGLRGTTSWSVILPRWCGRMCRCGALGNHRRRPCRPGRAGVIRRGCRRRPLGRRG